MQYIKGFLGNDVLFKLIFRSLSDLLSLILSVWFYFFLNPERIPSPRNVVVYLVVIRCSKIQYTVDHRPLDHITNPSKVSDF